MEADSASRTGPPALHLSVMSVEREVPAAPTHLSVARPIDAALALRSRGERRSSHVFSRSSFHDRTRERSLLGALSRPVRRLIVVAVRDADRSGARDRSPREIDLKAIPFHRASRAKTSDPCHFRRPGCGREQNRNRQRKLREKKRARVAAIGADRSRHAARRPGQAAGLAMRNAGGRRPSYAPRFADRLCGPSALSAEDIASASTTVPRSVWATSSRASSSRSSGSALGQRPKRRRRNRSGAEAFAEIAVEVNSTYAPSLAFRNSPSEL